MKVGILTLPLHSNYGGILQAWALQTVLEDFGHQVQVFGIKHQGHHWLKMPLVWIKRVVKKALKLGNTPIFIEIYQKRIHKIKYSTIDKFISTRINTAIISSLENLHLKNPNAIVVGSDQIWREDYIRYLWKCNKPEYAFLSGVTNENIIKIAYAASLGIDRWSFNQESTKDIIKSLSTFKAVSIREISGVELLKELTGMEVDYVCDPTMLLDAKTYLERLNIEPKPKSNIVSYILDPSDLTEKLINLVCETYQTNVYEINNPDKNGSYPSVEDWVRDFASAKMVITDSFHGCVFSIIFRKPLIFLKNSNRGSTRFDTLIETFGLQENIISDICDFQPKASYNLPKDLDIKLNRLRDHSLHFLKLNLS